jgi:hypothetical protein
MTPFRLKRKVSMLGLAIAFGYAFANTHRDRGQLKDRLRYNTEGPVD